MRVLGIDPGLRVTGYACLHGLGDPPGIVEAGVFRLSSSSSVASRLVELEQDIRELLERTRPDLVAIESLFAHARFPATAIVMGHARGVILLSIERAGVPMIELKPNLVKRSMTGNGLACKEQMQKAVQSYFRLAELPKPPDVADAIAIALCGARRSALPV